MNDSLPGAGDGVTGFLPIVAHAFGKRYDLPVPLWLFVFGGAAVVFLSFLLVLPRAVAPATAGEARLADVSRCARPRRCAGSSPGLFAIGLMVCGWVGSQSVAENIVPSFFWLAVWVATPISCGIIGDWTRAVNPFAALARVCDRPALRATLLGDDGVVAWPRWLGWWPAVALFFTVACGELIYNGTATLPAFTAWGLLVYALVSAVAGLLFGAQAWTERGELFSVLFATWGRLGWFRFGAEGRRGFGGGLRVPFEAHVSRVTFVLLLLVSVSFDGLLSTPAWKTLRTQISLSGVAFELFETAAFAVARAGGLGAVRRLRRAGAPLRRHAALAAAGARRAGAVAAADRLRLPGRPQRRVPGHQRPAVHPAARQPRGLDGVHLLPPPFNDSYEINPNLLPSSVVWYIQVALIIFVHIAAVVLAHRYLARASRSHAKARASEWPWIVAMVGYTMTSLWLLAQPLVQETSSAAVRVVTAPLAILLR